MITIKELKIDNESGLKIIQLIKKHEPKIWETLKEELTQALNIPVVVKSLPLKTEPPQVIKDNGLDAKDWDNDCT